MISPGINSSLPPRFYELDSLKFQELCADLLAQDRRYSNAEVYGRNGQTQLGIDVIAMLADRSGLEVGQCKCWKGGTTAAKVLQASEEFLPNLQHWKDKGLKRFILFAACPTDDTKVQDQILNEIQRFKRLGVVYEVWDARKLHRELRPHRNVVRTHLQNEYWVEQICGPCPTAADAATVAGTLATVRRNGALIIELADERNEELESVRELAAEGRGQEALQALLTLEGRPSWPDMPLEIRAKALRIRASLMLNVHGDFSAAQQLLTQAKAVYPSGNTRLLEAMLSRNSEGPQVALGVLGIPTSLDEWNFRLELLLELGRVDDVLAESGAPPSDVRPNTETAVARSLALLLNRQVEAARQEIQTALVARPNHFSVRHTAAVVDYASTISTAFAAWVHLTWPVPPNWNLVRRDPASVAARETAAKVFRELVTLVPDQEKDSLRIWEVACVANEPERQQEAQALIRSILRKSPTYAPAIFWAWERGYEIDQHAVVEALRQSVREPTATQEEVTALITLLANTGELAAAEAILEDMRPKYVAWDALHSWRNLKAQCLCARGEVDEAMKLVESEDQKPWRRVLKTVVLRSTIPKTKAVRTLARHLREAFEEFQDGSSLLSCCEAQAQAGDWQFVADHAEQLVAAVQTESALRLAVQATINLRRVGQTRALLETHAAICTGGSLPADLCRLRAECLRLEGQMPQAITELEKLAQAKPDFSTLEQLFRFQQAKGDLPASTLTARRFLEIPNVPASFLLEVAPAVRLKDPHLAAQLWQKAAESVGADPALKAYAAYQSFRLGIESKASEFLKELPALAESGEAPIKMMGLQETVDFIRAANEDAQKITDLYSRGAVPAHVLSGRVGCVLARLFMETATENLLADFPRLRPPLLVRHAGRGSQSSILIPGDEKCIFLDITSFLLLFGLRLLEAVEQGFEKVVVSGHLASALGSQLDKLTHHQPNLLSAKRELLIMLEASKVKQFQPRDEQCLRNDNVAKLMGARWCTLLEHVRAHEGLLIDHLPLISNGIPPQPVALPPEDAKLICGERELAGAMVAAGLMSAETPSAGNLSLTSGPLLRAGMPVYFEYGIAEQLAAAGVLARLAAHCTVFISAHEALEIRREIELADKNEHLKSQIDQALLRLSYGQNNSKYETHLHLSPEPAGRTAPPATPEEACLYDAIHFGETVGAPVCCDDRFLQSHQRIGRSAIIGIMELLHHLRRKEFVNEHTYFESMVRLRAANARYIEPTAEEILYHLRRAPVDHGALEETPALRTLRRAVAAMLLDRDRLQEPITNEAGVRVLREMEFPAVCNRAILDALVELWADDKPGQETVARADWLWENLFLDFRFFRQCFNSLQAPDSDLRWLGMTIAVLYTQALRLRGDRTKRASLRRRYYDWITGRALMPVARNTPQIFRAVAEAITETMAVADQCIEKARKEHGEKNPEAMGFQILVAETILDLPKEVITQSSFSDQAMERWGLRSQGPGVEVAGLKCSRREFWGGICRAIKNGGATLRAIDGKSKLRVSRGVNPTTLRIGKDGTLRLDVLGILYPDVEQRRNFLCAHPRWFDLDCAERELAIEKIVSEKQPEDRIALLEIYREASLPQFYSLLGAAFQKDKAITIDDLMPSSMDALLRFLRLRNSLERSESDVSSESAKRLLASEGIEETICRLSCLPVHLPTAVISEFDTLERAERLKLLDALSRRLTSFVQRLHLGRLYIHASAIYDPELDQVRQLIGSLCDAQQGLAEAKAFVCILRWVHLRLGWIADSRGWPQSVKLLAAWAHAAQLQSVFRGGPLDELADWFLAHCGEIDADQAGAAGLFERDVCHPRNLDYGGLLVCGLGFLFEGAAEETIVMSGVREALARTLETQGKDIIGSPTLWQLVPRQSNLLNSFWGTPRELFLPRLLTPDAWRTYFDIDAGLHFQNALQQLQLRPADATLWMLIDFLSGSGSLEQSEVEHVNKALAVVDFQREFDTNAKLPELVMVTCRHVALSGNATLKGQLRTQLFQLTRTAASVWNSDQAGIVKAWDWRWLGAALIDGVWKLNIVPDNPPKTVGGFLKDVSVLFQNWPLLATGCRQTLTALAAQLPIDCQTAWVPTLLEIRALS